MEFWDCVCVCVEERLVGGERYESMKTMNENLFQLCWLGRETENAVVCNYAMHFTAKSVNLCNSNEKVPPYGQQRRVHDPTSLQVPSVLLSKFGLFGKTLQPLFAFTTTMDDGSSQTHIASPFRRWISCYELLVIHRRCLPHAS